MLTDLALKMELWLMLNMKNVERKYPIQQVCTNSDLDKASEYPTDSGSFCKLPPPSLTTTQSEGIWPAVTLPPMHHAFAWQVRLSVIDVTNMQSQHGHKKAVVSQSKKKKKTAGKVMKCDGQAYFLTIASHFTLLKGKKKEYIFLGNIIRKNNL